MTLPTPEQLNANRIPFGETLDIRFTHVSADELRAEMTVRPDMCTLPAILHGGATMALADNVAATAAFLNLPEGAAGTTTVESKTNFLAPAPVGSVVRAIATPVQRGRRLQVWQTRIESEAGKLLALVTQTQITL